MYLTAEEELKQSAEMDNLRRTIKSLIAESEYLAKELEAARAKLVEVQERNRKLDWLLTKAVEKL